MEVRYRREWNHNYMIMDAPEGWDGYECRMLAGNQIEGLLLFRLRHGEAGQEFYYEITSKQPLSRVYERRKVSGAELRQLLTDLLAAVSRMEEYLLREDQILLDPDYIYAEPDQLTIELCFLPGYSGSWSSGLSSLLKFLLERADHADRDGVILAYNLYQESLKENYGPGDLQKHLSGGTDYIFGERQEEGGRELKERGQPEKDTERLNPAVEAERGREEVLYSGRTASKLSLPEKKLEAGELPKDRIGKKAGETVLTGVFFLAALEGVIWYLHGLEGVRSYGAGAAGVVFLLLFLNLFVQKRNISSKREEPEHKIVVQEGMYSPPEKDTETASWELRTESEELYQSRVQKQLEEEMKKSQEEGTVLLNGSGTGSCIGILEPMNREFNSIRIAYVPFTIGKHKQLSDYCLDAPTVSRLHLRIDKKEDVCIITDLNSTNGTAVNEYQLQANETVSIKNGDVIYLAENGFRFYETRG